MSQSVKYHIKTKEETVLHVTVSQAVMWTHCEHWIQCFPDANTPTGLRFEFLGTIRCRSSWRRGQYVSPKRWYPPVSLHGLSFKEINIHKPGRHFFLSFRFSFLPRFILHFFPFSSPYFLCTCLHLQAWRCERHTDTDIFTAVETLNLTPQQHFGSWTLR